MLVRFDGEPGWDEKPTNRPGGLYLFDDGEQDNSLDIDAEEVEIRIYFKYPYGSYGKLSSGVGGGWSDDWKNSPVMNSLKLNYRKGWRVVHREDVPF